MQMAEYFADNPQLIVNGFVQAGIIHALNDNSELESQRDPDSDTELSTSTYEH